MRRVWISLLVPVVSAAGAATVLAAEPSDEIRALMQKGEELRRKVRDPLRQQIEQRRKVLEQQVDLKNLRFILENAQKAYDTKVAADEAIVETRKAAEAATKALPGITKKRLDEHPTLDAINRDLQAAEADRGKFQAEEQELKKQLYGLRRELEGAAELQDARQATVDADHAYRTLPQTHPKFVAARKAIEAAQKAMEKAREAYNELIRTSPEMARARQARSDAHQAYGQKLDEVVRTSPKGTALYQRLEELEQRQLEIEGQRTSLRQELSDTRRDLEKNDPVIVQARQTYEQARRRYQTVLAECAGEERKALDEARRALDRSLAEKMAQDIVMLELKDRLAKVEKQIAELYQQQRQLYKKRESGRRNRHD